MMDGIRSWLAAYFLPRPGVTPPQPLASEWLRRTIEMRPSFDQALSDLQDKLGLASQPEVIQQAVQVLTVIVEHGGQFWIERPDKALQLVVLNAAVLAKKDTMQ